MAKKVAKAKKTKAKSPVKKAAAKKPAKRLTARDKAINARLGQLGMSLRAMEDMLSLTLEIDRTSGQGGKLRLGDFAARTELARVAYGDAVLTSDDPKAWLKSARDAAGLP